MEIENVGQSSERKRRILVAACGTEAAENLLKICIRFKDYADVTAIVTKAAQSFFYRPLLAEVVTVHTDEDFSSPFGKNMHIELVHWADALVIVPLSPNTLAKMAGGMCDNLLTCVVKSWDYEKPMFVAPHMHPTMWKNPITMSNVNLLKGCGITLLSSETGAILSPEEIISYVISLII